MKEVVEGEVPKTTFLIPVGTTLLMAFQSSEANGCWSTEPLTEPGVPVPHGVHYEPVVDPSDGLQDGRALGVRGGHVD